MEDTKMKSTTTYSIAILFLLFASSAFGQLTKGNYFLFGSSNLDISAEKKKESTDGIYHLRDKSSSFYMRPGAGYLVMDNLVAGLQLYLSTSESHGATHGTEGTKHSSLYTSVGPFARYYFKDINKFKPLAQISFGIGHDKTTNTTPSTGIGTSSTTTTTTKTSYGTFDFALGGGASYFITENVSFDGLLGYSVEKSKDKLNTNLGYKSSGLFLEFGVSITIAK
jgi:opacity protein-like surface antigen